jgi:hypothetical protein
MVTFMPFSSLMFFTSMGIMEGRSAADIKQRWQTVSTLSSIQAYILIVVPQNFPSILQKQYMVFAPAQVSHLTICSRDC